MLLHGLRGPANHDGGGLAIGPDGKLYVGAGDTGCNSGQPPPPPDSRIGNYTGTCLTTANGKILRINLDGSIPSDNPLQGVSVRACDATSCVANPGGAPVTGMPRTEIWAWGFRNPWRFSFDAQTGFLWVGDVGEVTYEEIDLVRGGQHYGWPWREGGVGDPVSTCATLGANGGGSGCVDPKYFCKHGIASGFASGREVTVYATLPDGSAKTFQATVRIDTPQEVLYYKHGGILQYVLRQLLQDAHNRS